MNGSETSRESAASESRALDGLRVIDLTRVLSGPYCTQMLGDHGAEVIKIEPLAGDLTRNWGPSVRESDNATSFYLGLNRNKKGMAINLASQRGQEIVLKLLKDADIIVENFLPGTMEKWGLGYDTLRLTFPKLIFCSISGFGASGPLGGYPGYDAVVQAMSGIMSLNGDAEGAPVRAAVPIVDMASGMNACIGILMALFERARSGEGQFVEATMYDSGIALLYPYITNYLNAEIKPVRSGNGHPSISPYDKFETATNSIFLGIGNDAQFQKLCRIIKREDLSSNQKFDTNLQRLEHKNELCQELKNTFLLVDGVALAETLLQQGIPCGPIMNVEEVLAHPHTRHRKMIVEGPDRRAYRNSANPVKLSRTPARLAELPPEFAQDTADLLSSIGYTAVDIEELTSSGAILLQRSMD